MTSLSPTEGPRCPECGFRIFNRRYPRCESCKSLLPAELLYSREQIEQMQVREQAEALARSENRTRKPGDSQGDGGAIFFPNSGGAGCEGGDGGAGGCWGGD